MRKDNILVTAFFVGLVGIGFGLHSMANSAAAQGRRLEHSQAQAQKSLDRAATAAYVYRICNASRISPTITEQGCDDAQTATNSEFLCVAGNSDPSNYCWVEVK